MLVLILEVVVVDSLCSWEVVVGVGFWTDSVLRSAVQVPSIINNKVTMARGFFIAGGLSSLTALRPCWSWLVVVDVCPSSLVGRHCWRHNGNGTMAVVQCQYV